MKAAVLAASAVLLASSCGTAATPARLTGSFADAFTGLYVTQQSSLGRTDVSRASLRTVGACRRTGPNAEGPGEDWVCRVQYDDSGTASTQSFEVQVKPDGCWKADAPPSVQPAVLADPVSGASSVNQLAEFDGCLDTSWR